MTELVIAVLLGLAVNECCDLSPWVGQKLVRWAAHHLYTDPAMAAARAEELAAYIDDRPGKLLKLLVAVGFVTRAVVTRRKADSQLRKSVFELSLATLFWLMTGGIISVISSWLSMQSMFGIMVPSANLSFAASIVVGLCVTVSTVLAPIISTYTTAPVLRILWLMVLLINIGMNLLGAVWYGVMKNPLNSGIVFSEIVFDPTNWLQTTVYFVFVLFVVYCSFKFGQALNALNERYHARRHSSLDG